MCSLFPRVATKTLVVVVMHGLEHPKPTNTGKLVVACLPHSELHLFGPDLPPLMERPWPATHTPVVLFPVAGAEPIEAFRGTRDMALIALDGSWRQAARLRRRFATLGVRFAAAPAGPSVYRLRAEPDAQGMSTFEAVTRSLAVLEGIDPEPLERTLRIFRDRTLWCRGSIRDHEVEGGLPPGITKRDLTRGS